MKETTVMTALLALVLMFGIGSSAANAQTKNRNDKSAGDCLKKRRRKSAERGTRTRKRKTRLFVRYS